MKRALPRPTHVEFVTYEDLMHCINKCRKEHNSFVNLEKHIPFDKNICEIVTVDNKNGLYLLKKDVDEPFMTKIQLNDYLILDQYDELHIISYWKFEQLYLTKEVGEKECVNAISTFTRSLSDIRREL